jgi:hypothetical protein
VDFVDFNNFLLLLNSSCCERLWWFNWEWLHGGFMKNNLEWLGTRVGHDSND